VTSLKRRALLKSALAVGALIVTTGAGLLRSTRALAADWPKSAFEAKTGADAIKNLYGAVDASSDKVIDLEAPFQAENGAVVPITVSTALPNVESISIVVEKNPAPLIASVSLSNGARGYFKARMKMAESSEVKAYVKTRDKLYMVSQQVKVTVGGCGG
jgi:sulfur-oxidizing protein SoxY